MNRQYHDKYQKYKAKYMNLKKMAAYQTGGNPIIFDKQECYKNNLETKINCDDVDVKSHTEILSKKYKMLMLKKQIYSLNGEIKNVYELYGMSDNDKYELIINQEGHGKDQAHIKIFEVIENTLDNKIEVILSITLKENIVYVKFKFHNFVNDVSFTFGNLTNTIFNQETTDKKQRENNTILENTQNYINNIRLKEKAKPARPPPPASLSVQTQTTPPARPPPPTNLPVQNLKTPPIEPNSGVVVVKPPKKAAPPLPLGVIPWDETVGFGAPPPEPVE